MLDKDFNQFNPNKDNWIYFYFCKDQRYRNNIGNEYTVDEAEELFDKLAEIITKNACNIFQKVKKFVLMNKSKRIGKVILKEAVNCAIGISADRFFDIKYN